MFNKEFYRFLYRFIAIISATVVAILLFTIIVSEYVMRITDQYFWNFIFSFFFLAVVVMGIAILEGGSAHRDYSMLTIVDYILLSLATWRAIRLFVYDAVTKFIREQFLDVQTVKGRTLLVKPEKGPRRTIADLLSCPWCFGVWAAAILIFLHLYFAWGVYISLLLAISAVATFLQLLANLVGHRAEQLKLENDRNY